MVRVLARYTVQPRESLGQELATRKLLLFFKMIGSDVIDVWPRYATTEKNDLVVL